MRSTINLLLLAAGAILILTGCLSPAATPEEKLPPTSQDKAVEPVSPLTVPYSMPPGEDTSPLPQPTSTPTPGEGSTAVSAESPAAEGIALVYARSGGLAGVSERWVIYDDGRVVTGDGQEAYVMAKAVTQFVRDAEKLGFFEMASRYMSKNTCCDRFTYEIMIRSADRTNTVVTLDATPNAPQALWDILSSARQLVEQIASSRNPTQ